MKKKKAKAAGIYSTPPRRRRIDTLARNSCQSSQSNLTSFVKTPYKD
ncbi:hypothetical protein F442_09617 [Phytophthora nicotianae P10297]|uniref:Uncharacterized protein n=1 Tax=Phytophthora nicotianae P10297 TaxID=1317064 RepID=W2Z8M4_PHYNI|nr:hypothetical protein F442_09617 [Phytophthora nicotianae P10297]